MKRFAVAALLALAVPFTAHAGDRAEPAKVEKVYRDMFKNAKGEWARRLDQDETQKVCSETRNNPSNAQFEAIKKRAEATIKMPADGKVMGDWKRGEKVAQSGFGLRFNDKPGTVPGGNCYACHQMSKTELSFGTLGPSLLDYGKIRKFDPREARIAYDKIYNSETTQPCSTMPRFGHMKILTEQQIKDLVALLFDPDSPVNK
ncbi:MAG: sulfur oxidation c-type cytochrome SoxX [Hyphomicrobiaceae bacterium]